MSCLQEAGEPVIGTTRRQEAVDDRHMYLDLSDNPDGWDWHRHICIAFICAGVTQHYACTRNPVGTARVNVHGVCDLLDKLVEQGAFVVYMSSNAVFDGSVAHRQADEPTSPITEYGRQKAEAEKGIGQFADSAAIVRFTKIVGPATEPFSGWRVALGKGETIHPFSDMYLAPVPLSFAVSVLRLIGDRRLSGIFQVSGERDVSYSEAALLGGCLLGAPSKLVQPMEAEQSGRWLGQLPAHTTLNVDRLKSALGTEPPDVRWTIESAFINPQALSNQLCISTNPK